jgi:selenocysteine-specific elongation factor
MPRDEVRHRAGTAISTDLFDAVVAAMTQRREVAGADRLHLPSHDPGLGPAQREAAHAVLDVLEAAGLQPPDLETLADATGLPGLTVRELILVLAREGRVRRVGELVFHAAPLAGLAADVRGLGVGRTVDVAAFKQRFGLSRKFAIPLLEWLDRERVTRRQGDVRMVL